jgi:RNA-directed DNA polymerase
VGQPGAASGEPLDPNRREVSERWQRGASQAPPVERGAIPPAAGRQRPMGQPTLEANRGQRAPGAVRHASYEPALLGCSSGARPGRRPPPALEAVTGGMEKRHRPWGLDADMRRFSEAMAHAGLGQWVAPRLGAPRVVRHMGQGRKAGVREEGPGRPQAAGTPPGGSARPLLAKLSLHDVCALWAAPGRRRSARGDVISVRDGDDGIVGGQDKDAAAQCLSALRARCHRFHLELHPEKTRLREFGRFARERRQRRGQGKPETFDFLGLTHMCGTTKRGKVTVRRGTIATRLRQNLQEVKQPLRERRHGPIEKRGAWLKSVVVGHYRYYGVPRNMGRLWVFRERILRSWCRILRRRSQRHRMTWQRMYRLATQWLPEPHIMHPYPAQRLRVTTRGRSPVQ